MLCGPQDEQIMRSRWYRAAFGTPQQSGKQPLRQCRGSSQFKAISSRSGIIGIARRPHVGRASSGGLSASWLSILTRRIQKRCPRFKVSRARALGETVVARLQDFPRGGATTLIAWQPGETGRGAQFPGKGVLPMSGIERLPKEILGRGRCPRWVSHRRELSFDAHRSSHFRLPTGGATVVLSRRRASYSAANFSASAARFSSSAFASTSSTIRSTIAAPSIVWSVFPAL